MHKLAEAAACWNGSLPVFTARLESKHCFPRFPKVDMFKGNHTREATMHKDGRSMIGGTAEVIQIRFMYCNWWPTSYFQ